MGLLMMLTILTAFLSTFKLPLPKVSGALLTQQQAEAASLRYAGSYRDTVLESLCRQTEEAAVRIARGEGYQNVWAEVKIAASGKIEAIYLYEAAEAMPAFAGNSQRFPGSETLKNRIAEELSLSVSLIHVGKEEKAE